MNSYFDFFGKINCPCGFFIGANTGAGFRNLSEEYLSEESFSKIYILKGGPGTGKSTLMKKLAGEAGGKITCLYCSSDPDSLDGIIIEKGKNKAAVVDGTAPHGRDPEYPGACGVTVDLGVSFDRAGLTEQKEKIIEYTKMKRAHFKKAYGYLSAAEEIGRVRRKMTQSAYLTEKAMSAVRRLVGKNAANKKGTLWVRETLALSCKGALRVPGFDMAEHKIYVADSACLMSPFLEMLADEYINAGYEVWMSESPVSGAGEIYVPETDTLYSPFCEEYAEKVINLRRFVDTGVLSEMRGKLNITGKCFSMAVGCALEELADAGEAHRELEKIYTRAVDFSAVDGIYEYLLRDLRGSPRGGNGQQAT